jgi:hypothetical protein
MERKKLTDDKLLAQCLMARLSAFFGDTPPLDAIGDEQWDSGFSRDSWIRLFRNSDVLFK